MKLATLYDPQHRDGRLVVVSTDLKWALLVSEVAPNLQTALDNHQHTFPILQERARQLEDPHSGVDKIDFQKARCNAPLPRAYQWADGSAYLNHVELVRKARKVEMPVEFLTDPLMYQGGSDTFLGPRDPILLRDPSYGLDYEAEVAIVTSDVPMGASIEEAGQYILLLMLVNDVSLRNLITGELAKGFGFFQSKPSSAFSPVAVTPDELGNAWHHSKVHLPLHSYVNEEWMGSPNAGIDMQFNFSQLIAHAAKTRALSAGTIIGSGTVSNYNRATGCSCLAEKRCIEVIELGKAQSPFLTYGDRVRIQMMDEQGNNIFGTIDQVVQPYTEPNS